MITTQQNESSEWESFRKAENPIVIHNCKVGCVLGIIFMPAGAVLDFFVYPDEVGYFFTLRLICSILLMAVLMTFNTELGRRHCKVLGQIEVSLPLIFISSMIYQTEGAASPYYAGLNLVLLGSGLVLRWSLSESISLIVIASTVYLGACYAHDPQEVRSSIFVNNIYFLIVTGVFIATGTYFNDRLRFREWRLKEELKLAKEATEQANERLMELDEAKSNFFANISHELRTPLTLLLTPLEALLSRAGRPELAGHKETMEIMHQNGLKLLKQINDLLELVRFDADAARLETSTIHVGRFLNGICHSFKGLLEEKQLQFRFDVPTALGTLDADRDKLEKVFRNLIHNAVKFTQPGGTISLSARREGALLKVKVEDTGIGIAADNLPRLFDRFWQADPSARRKHQGSGIGLALAREIVTAQGGEIIPTSEEGKGTTMLVTLPGLDLSEVPEDQADMPMQPPSGELEEEKEQDRDIMKDLFRRAELFASASNTVKGLPVRLEDDRDRISDRLPKLLIADDEPQMRSFLRSQLKDSYQILEASDGREAVEMARQYRPSLILMDNMMPEIDGLQASHEIRKNETLRGIPILMLTARADEQTKLNALEAGVNDFLSKPFSLTELHTRLRNLVEASRFEQELARKNKRLHSTVSELNDTIERLKETETQLVQSEKMASLGTMSAGIVHEINNPMNYVRAAVQALETLEVGEDCEEDFKDILADINDGVTRVIDIVTSLLSFAHPDGESQRDYTAQEIVEHALRLVGTRLDENLRVEVDIEPALQLHVSRNPMIQLVMNLLQNAQDATRQKEFTPPDHPLVTIRGESDGDITRLIIRDNGPGIPEEIRNKIFDPFFTTKDVGEGTGLGLSICYRIAKQNQGSITVETEAGRFTEFRLEFPSQMPL